MVPSTPFNVQSSEVLSNLFESLPIGVVAMTADTRVVVFNEHEEKLAGRKRERVLGRRFFEEIAPCMNVRELAGKFRDKVQQATLDETIEFSVPFAHASQPRDVIVRMRSFLVGGEPHGMLLIEDISMRRSLERMRETLASLLVHDMKSPLTNVIGNFDYVLQELSGKGFDETLAAATDGRAGAWRLNRMIHDLLDITRLETGTFPLQREPTNIATVLDAAIAGVRASAHSQSVSILSSFAPQLDAAVDADVLRRILDNLLDNAVRHSRAGSRVVVAASEENGLLTIDVIDEGSGIPMHLRDKIFDKFGTFERGGRRPSNHGLGLTFVRMAAEAHGGDAMIIDDGRPQGTTFRVLLPSTAP